MLKIIKPVRPLLVAGNDGAHCPRFGKSFNDIHRTRAARSAAGSPSRTLGDLGPSMPPLGLGAGQPADQHLRTHTPEGASPDEDDAVDAFRLSNAMSAESFGK
jgi:hypothetical protein